MEELAAHSVRTVEVLVVLLAELGLVVGGHVLLLLYLPDAVRERTLLNILYFLLMGLTYSYRLIELAVAKELPIPAHFGLVLHHKAYQAVIIKALLLLSLICCAAPGMSERIF